MDIQHSLESGDYSGSNLTPVVRNDSLQSPNVVKDLVISNFSSKHTSKVSSKPNEPSGAVSVALNMNGLQNKTFDLSRQIKLID